MPGLSQEAGQARHRIIVDKEQAVFTPNTSDVTQALPISGYCATQIPSANRAGALTIVEVSVHFERFELVAPLLKPRLRRAA
jgi:hypothetical protein